MPRSTWTSRRSRRGSSGADERVSPRIVAPDDPVQAARLHSADGARSIVRVGLPAGEAVERSGAREPASWPIGFPVPTRRNYPTVPYPHSGRQAAACLEGFRPVAPLHACLLPPSRLARACACGHRIAGVRGRSARAPADQPPLRRRRRPPSLGRLSPLQFTDDGTRCRPAARARGRRVSPRVQRGPRRRAGPRRCGAR